MTQPTQQANPLRILRGKEVFGPGSRTGLSKSTVYAMVRRGEFPAPVSLGARAVGWSSHLVDGWINVRIETCAQIAGAK